MTQQEKIDELEKTIDEMLEYVNKEGKRLSMNFASYAIGHSVKTIGRKLKEIAGKEDEV